MSTSFLVACVHFFSLIIYLPSTSSSLIIVLTSSSYCLYNKSFFLTRCIISIKAFTCYIKSYKNFPNFLIQKFICKWLLLLHLPVPAPPVLIIIIIKVKKKEADSKMKFEYILLKMNAILKVILLILVIIIKLNI